MTVRAPEGVAPNGRGRACLRLAIASLVAACVVGAGREARADDVQELELGKNEFDTGQYGDAAKRFQRMLDPAAPPCDRAPSGACRLTEPDLIERARVLYAASLVALGRGAEADAQIESIYRANPGYAPNPALFPQEVLDRFTNVKARLRDELERIRRERIEEARRKDLLARKQREAELLRIRELERLASQETVVHKSSRWIAMVPFGVGQFQNGQNELGLVFLVSQALLGGASVGTSIAVSERTSAALKPGADVETIGEDIDTLATWNRVTFGLWAGSTVLGIVLAQATFVPERLVTYRPRPLPRPAVAPTVAVSGSGASLGVAGRF